MQIIEIKNSAKKKWNVFALKNNNNAEFLQSWEWGEFQEFASNPSTWFDKTHHGPLGARKIWHLAVTGESDEFLATALLIKHGLPLGKNYLYCPRGPVIHESRITNHESRIKILELFLNRIREIAKKENSVFFKWEPAENYYDVIESPALAGRGNLASAALNSDFRNSSFGFFNPSANLQPRDTLILNLNETEEELLAQMKQKTRYNIRLAEKHEVKVRISNEETFESDFEKFWALIEETAARDKFQSHSKEYYRKMLKILGGEIFPQKLIAKIFLAEFEGKILAANIMVFFGNRATYLHGASGAAYRNFMTPYLLQWEQIKKARRSGFKEYDFWGIAAKNQKPIPSTRDKNQKLVNYKIEWEGITRFKTGFGGREINYPEAIDIVYQQIVYKAIKIAKKAAQIFRK